jgi:hypothetical protein
MHRLPRFGFGPVVKFPGSNDRLLCCERDTTRVRHNFHYFHSDSMTTNTIEVTKAPPKAQDDAPDSCPMTAEEPSPTPTGEFTASTSALTETPNPCASIGEGNLSFFLVNTRNPDEVIFLALQDISAGMEILH